MKGDAEAALRAMQQESFEVYGLLGQVMAHHALGRKPESDATLVNMIEKYERDWPYDIAYLLAYRGEADRAFAWLDKAVEYNDPGLYGIATEPLFASLHADPRWLPFFGKTRQVARSVGGNRVPGDAAGVDGSRVLPFSGK